MWNIYDRLCTRNSYVYMELLWQVMHNRRHCVYGTLMGYARVTTMCIWNVAGRLCTTRLCVCGTLTAGYVQETNVCMWNVDGRLCTRDGYVCNTDANNYFPQANWKRLFDSNFKGVAFDARFTIVQKHYDVFPSDFIDDGWILDKSNNHIFLDIITHLSVTSTGFAFLHTHIREGPLHFNDAIMSAMGMQITSLTIVYSTAYSGEDQRTYHRSTRHWPLSGKSPVTDEFPAQKKQYMENVSIWWRLHVK